MENGIKILNFGSMNLDYVYRVHEFPKPGETIAAISQSVNPGGKGLNQSVALAKAGAEVYHAGVKGIGGDLLVDTLARNGVHTEYIENGNVLQGNAVIYVNDAGENNIVLFGGSNRSLTREQIRRVMEHFQKGDWLLLQNEVNELGFLVEEAYKRGLCIALNPSPYDSQLTEVDYDKLSMIFVNEVEGEALSGEREPRKMLEKIHARYPRLRIVLTLGADGAWYKDATEELFQESFPVKAVDTTAAGDTFSGYFLACVLRGMKVQDGMRYAAKAASVTVTRPGAGEAIPMWEEVCI